MPRAEMNKQTGRQSFLYIKYWDGLWDLSEQIIILRTRNELAEVNMSTINIAKGNWSSFDCDTLIRWTDWLFWLSTRPVQPEQTSRFRPATCRWWTVALVATIHPATCISKKQIPHDFVEDSSRVEKKNSSLKIPWLRAKACDASPWDWRRVIKI